jgi:hypothetical protein
MNRSKRIACIVGAMVAMLFALAAPSAEANGGGGFSSQRTTVRTRVRAQRQPIFSRQKTVIVNQQAAYVAPAPVVFEQQQVVVRAAPARVYYPQAAPVFVPQFAPAYSYGAAVQFAAPSCAQGGCGH